MRKFTILLAFLLFAGMQAALAQLEVKGTVTDAKDGTPLPGVSIVVKGTLTGTVTDMNGKYTITVPAGYNDLIFSFIGMLTREVQIEGRAIIDVVMEDDVVGLDEVVVTALGISREKKSLGYSTQEVAGEDINVVKGNNFVNSLSGKISGVQVKSSGNMGGSTNIVIRGSSSLTGNNQALFVVDGVPISNDNVNSRDQIRGRSGYDYGNAASDINPNDIESINVLKGAAATALYGSRAANGVVIITTKKGVKSFGKKKYGVSITSNITAGFVDKKTFPEYQTQYGAGYGASFYSDTVLNDGTYHYGFEYYTDVNGDGTWDFTVPTYEDASFGEKFDPNVLVYQWDSYDPANENYHKATPWVAAENGPEYVLNTAMSYTNSIEVMGGGDVSTFRLSYTNLNQKGILPNSTLKRNSFLLNGSYDIIKNLRVTASFNYVRTDAVGRNSTGYSDNLMSSFRQWMQTNVDYKQQEDIYNETERNVTWNPVAPDDLAAAYWDNPYFQRFKCYESDWRDRLIGYVQVDWQITGYLSAMGRVSLDGYNELIEERKEVGSSSGEFGVGNPRPDVTSGYSRLDRSFTETNLDLMLKFNKDLGENFNLTALLGTNIRHTKVDQVFASTDGGLIVPGLFALSNSVNQMQNPDELYTEEGVNGYYISASLGFRRYLFLDGTFRYDISSTLPPDDWSYPYYGISASFLFSELLDAEWMQFGKLRVNYAQVGNAAPPLSIYDTYTNQGSFVIPDFSGTSIFTLPNNKNNQHLKPEISDSWEAGLEMKFLQSRLGFDLAFYQSNTVNQIMPVAVSFATGYSGKYVNAGEVRNQGVELMIEGRAIKSTDFTWDLILNWAKNVNEVVSLEGDLENLQISALQGGLTINARVGEPYGTIQGTDYVYNENGDKVVGSNGYYIKTTRSDIVLGNIQPDWVGGLTNKFSYKNWALSFLIDWQKGGSVFSLDMYYGLGTGLYPETVYTNDLGNPVRDPLTEDETSGGLILPGVVNVGTVEEPIWEENTRRVAGDDYRVFGWSRNPNSKFIYDASYVKLREVVLTYNLPAKLLEKTAISGLSLSLVGSNLWILYKDLPYADPEAGHTGGNVQGWQSGVMPTTRNIGLTVNLQF